MANTYELIQKTALTSNQATITFNTIPQTYNDLVLRMSASISTSGRSSVRLLFNADTAPSPLGVELTGSGTNLTTIYDPATSGDIYIYPGAAPTSSSAPGLCEVYIPRYTSSSSFSPISMKTAIEENGTTGQNYLHYAAWLYNKSAAKTSFTLTLFSGSFLADSTFYLYGIKNT